MPATRAYVDPLAVDPRPHTTATSRGWGRAWRAALAEADTRPVVVDFWGDSITRGTGGGPSSGTNYWTTWWTNSYVGRTITGLQAQYGDGGSGYVPLQLAGPTTGTWTAVAANAGAPYGASTVTATAAASIAVAVRGTEVRIPHMNNGVTGSWRYRIDGGSWTTVTTPSGFSLDPACAVADGLSDGDHTVDIEWVSGTVRLGGIEARRSTGVLRRLFAQGGRNASEFSAGAVQHLPATWTNASGTLTAIAGQPGFTMADRGRYVFSAAAGIATGAIITAVAADGLSATMSPVSTAAATNQQIMLSHLPPSVDDAARLVTFERTADGFARQGLGPADLVVVSLGVNDAGSPLWSTPQRVAEGYAAVVSGYTNRSRTPDFVFLVQHWGNRGDLESDYPASVGMIRNVAEGVGATVVDMWAVGRRSYEFFNSSGYFDDTVHPSPAGHSRIADALLAAI